MGTRVPRQGNENQNVWVLCENIPVLVSAQNIRPAGDAEALARAILHGHSIIPEAIVRGQQELEDATAVPAEDSTAPVEGSMSIATHVVPPHEDDGPLPSMLENEVFNEPEARRERSRSLYLNEQQLALADVLVLQSQTPSVHLLDAPHVLPRTIWLRRYVTTLSGIRESEIPGDDQAQASIAGRSRTKFIAFIVNRVLAKEQVEHQRDLKDLH